jgi:hypothetical protein
MNSNFNQISDAGLSQSSGGQGTPPATFAGPVDPMGQAAAGGHVSQGQTQAAPQATLPVAVADESASDDELDREWVNKAKDIVERTKFDPFAQSNELNKVKAEYLKARFGKEFNPGDKSS